VVAQRLSWVVQVSWAAEHFVVVAMEHEYQDAVQVSLWTGLFFATRLEA